MASHEIAFTPESSILANLSISMASHAVAATPVSSMIGTLALGVSSSLAIAFSPVSSLGASLALVVSTATSVAFNPVSSFSASLALAASDTVAVAFNPVSSFSSSLALAASDTVAVAFNPVSSFSASLALAVSKTNSIEFLPSSSLDASLDLSGMTTSMTLGQVVSEILNLWGIEGVCNAPDFALARAISDVNGAMQTIWNQAADRSYWTGSTLTLTFADGEDSQDLPTNIQNVVGPCRRSDNKRPLATIGSIGELETFSDLYLDGETADEPLAYHIDRLNQTGDDPAKIVLRITPAVVGDSLDLMLDVVIEAPRFYVIDLSECPIIPIPHGYVESLLLPIVRYKASSFWLFNNGESKPTIDRDYQLAMEAIGAADPLPGKSGDNKEASKK